jgi:tetratricopeptide (TPR) repeat protein
VKRLRAVLAAVLTGLLAYSAAAGAEQWLKLKSSHFELYTTAGEKKAREAILYFEQVQDFFSRARSSNAKLISDASIRIIAFRSEKEFTPYRINESAAAYYLNGYDRDYIVMGSISAESYPGAVHEFTHLLLKHAGIEVPIWFNEGLAELYSTLKPLGNKVAIGQVIPGRYYFLQENTWLTLEALTSVDRNSPFYNERDRAGMFYCESWALVHMLNLSPQYRPNFNKFLITLSSGVPATAAFSQVYGKTLGEVQKDLQEYMKGTHFNSMVFDIKLEKSAPEPEAQPAATLDLGVVLADLLGLTGKHEQAKERYTSLAKEFPQSWEVEAGLAELSFGARRADEACRHFARAVELGSRNPQLYYHYSLAVRAAGQPDTAAIPLLKKAVALNPQFAEARQFLAFCLLQDGQYQDAINNFKQVKQIKPDQAFSYYHALSYAYYKLGRWDDAQSAAEAARKYAREQQIRVAEEMLKDVREARSARNPGL